MSKNQSVGNCLVPVWAIPELLSEGSLQLPSFQRDAVWDEERVELLWDSLMRGMPIGNFIVSSSQKITSRNVSESRSVASYKHEDEDEDKERELLVDGQQRCIGIRQGLTPWTQKSSYRLWLDIDPKENDMRKDYKIKFSFFLCTRSWPWGFKPSDQSWRKCREELFEKHKDIIKGDVDEEIESDPTTWKPDYLLPLNYTWPARAKLPIPFSEILNWFIEDKNIQGMECQSGNWGIVKKLKESEIEEKVDRLFESFVSRNLMGIWGIEKEGEEGQNNREKIVKWIKEHQGRICEVLNRRIYFENSFEISDPVDPDEELGEAFNRINRLGIPLSNADLFFSGLKLILPPAHDLVWEIYKNRDSGKLIPPPGIAHAAVRLAIAKKNESIPPDKEKIGDRLGLNLRDVRILLDKTKPQKNIVPEITNLIESEDSKSLEKLFRIMRQMIEFRLEDTSEDGFKNLDFGIPLPLLSKIGSRRPYIMHNLLGWIANANHPIDIKNDRLRRKMVRYVIFDYFFVSQNNEYIKNSFSISINGSGDEFPDQEIIQSTVTENFDLRAEFFRDEKEPSVALISPKEFEVKISNVEWDPINLQDLLLWSQRYYLKKKFPDYDPTLFFSNASLPYDADHIWPKAQLDRRGRYCGNVTLFNRCKWWYLNSFGNYRILDKRENRSVGSALPRDKMDIKSSEIYFSIKPWDFENWRILQIRNNNISSVFLNRFKAAVNSRRTSIYTDLFEALKLSELSLTLPQSQTESESTDEG